jgi:hypothetical protein
MAHACGVPYESKGGTGTGALYRILRHVSCGLSCLSATAGVVFIMYDRRAVQ